MTESHSPRRDVFHAVADANRRRMLDLLLEGERPVGEIADHFDLSFQGVSQHLGILANARLVVSRKEGRFRYYRANPTALKEIDHWVARYRRFWNSRLARLAKHLDGED